MEIYKFEKSLLNRLDEIGSALSRPDVLINATQVFIEWSNYIEVSIEPTGWQATWKVPRLTCENMELPYPVVVFGMVEQVLFRDLQASFRVEAVQDSNIHLPEYHVVRLEDLYPTINQENTELNVETTADVIDAYRFFMNNVWMPWDNELNEDISWVDKHLESRIRFCYDLRSTAMNRPLAAHIKALLNEARCIQERKEHLEMNLSEKDENLENEVKNVEITELMNLHLRLSTIRAKVELLENPEMRAAYEDLHFKEVKKLQTLANSSKSDVAFVVSSPTKITDHINVLSKVKQHVKKDCLIHMSASLEDALSKYCSIWKIFLSPGNHPIKFLEHLHSGHIFGLPENSNFNESSLNVDQLTSTDVVIYSSDAESVLLVLNGNFTFENIVFQCNKVRLCMVVKTGNLRLKNCRLIGNGKSSTQQGICCGGNAQVTLENCLIENFATGITLSGNSSLTLSKTQIANCFTGLDWTNQTSKVHFNETTISKAKQYGIYIPTLAMPDNNISTLELSCLLDLNKYDVILPYTGFCGFNRCAKNVHVINSNISLEHVHEHEE
ncbi:protein nessun dorma [Teleopsis dalmanni]|uniref:protein nessun dorma n=1 Tax=Teleopsis dalmanni TaxID=139649 RepID=UPI0018CDFC4F|nr:protein nessun dorma [Teleopsis dalmanni]